MPISIHGRVCRYFLLYIFVCRTTSLHIQYGLTWVTASISILKPSFFFFFKKWKWSIKAVGKQKGYKTTRKPYHIGHFMPTQANKIQKFSLSLIFSKVWSYDVFSNSSFISLSRFLLIDYMTWLHSFVYLFGCCRPFCNNPPKPVSDWISPYLPYCY